jgi:hypothetical protein
MLHRLTFAAAAGACLLLVACESTPNTESTRRPTNDTRAVAIEDINTAAERMAANLVRDLNARLIENDFKDPSGEFRRVDLVFGDINNKTRTMSTDDFERLRSEIRYYVQANSSSFRQNVKLIQNRTRGEANLREEQGPNAPADHTVLPSSDPKYQYFLLGDAYRTTRGGIAEFYIEFQLMRGSDRELVWTTREKFRYDE